ncbi:hypothetical protein OPV22_007485 [Ensete ventricosum]|uniref:Uncharacterized protein n=1 Tax=Ensete ventricosum TaxID=4639 RepID=A0AAV8RU80_ENSVE|nr:hypothetical protein OPV22_007485 [Ensete ventricosum]
MMQQKHRLCDPTSSLGASSDISFRTGIGAKPELVVQAVLIALKQSDMSSEVRFLQLLCQPRPIGLWNNSNAKFPVFQQSSHGLCQINLKKFLCDYKGHGKVDLFKPVNVEGVEEGDATLKSMLDDGHPKPRLSLVHCGSQKHLPLDYQRNKRQARSDL